MPSLRYASLIAGLFAALALVGCDAEPVGPAANDIANVVNTDRDFETLREIALAAGFESVLAGPGPLTFFAPTDDAFIYLGSDTRDVLLDPANRALLQRVLRYHVVPGRIALADLTDGARLTTLDGLELEVTREGDQIRVDGALVDTENLVEAENGLVFPINGVLRNNLDTPSRLLLLPIARTFLGYAMETGADAALAEDDVTVFVPMNEAFEALGSTNLILLNDPRNADALTRLIDAHIVEGRIDLGALPDAAELPTHAGTTLSFRREHGQVFLNDHPVVATPALTTNGVIYLLTAPLLEELTLDQRIRTSAAFVTFEQQIRNQADLRARLSGPDPHTVFVFGNSGLNLLPPQTVTALNEPVNAALRDRLYRYHVVPGLYLDNDLTDGLQLRTIDDLPMLVRRSGNDLFVANRLVEETDLLAENGVIHRIPSALLPPSDLVDSAILFGLTEHVEALRNLGLESFFRDPAGRTLIAFPDSLYGVSPPLEDRPDFEDIVFFHAASTAIGQPTHNLSFDPIVGPRRTIAQGPDGTFRLDGIGELAYYVQATNGDLLSVDVVTAPSAPHVPLTR